MSYEVPERAVDRIAAEWNRVFAPPAEPTVEAEPAEEPEPEVGTGNHIPSAGHSPGELTDEQVKAITRSGKTNHELLAELLEQQRQGYTWYGQ